MKNWLTLFIFLLFTGAVIAQYNVPPYKQNKALPGFELRKANNEIFRSAGLKKGVPTLIMFFSPGCDHCIQQFESMVKRMNDLKNYNIVMATYQPLEELKEFDEKYKIARYPHIVTGRDENYFLPPFFLITNFPYMAFYDKNGMNTGVHEGNLKVDEIIKRLK